MAFALHDLPGGQPIADTSTVQKHPLGTRVRATDPTYGESEFIYLKGVVGTNPGNVVVYKQKEATTTLAVLASKGALAVSQSANGANQFAWYCVAGACQASFAGAAVADTQLYLTASAGAIDDVVTAGSGILGMVASAAVGGAGLGDVVLNHPNAGGL